MNMNGRDLQAVTLLKQQFVLNLISTKQHFVQMSLFLSPALPPLTLPPLSLHLTLDYSSAALLLMEL